MVEYPFSSSQKLEVINGSLVVDGYPFVVEYPREALLRVEDGMLITLFRGHLENQWNVCEIRGYFA